MAEIVHTLVRISIMLAVFGLGMKARWEYATFLRQNPGLLIRSIIGMNVIMPIFAAGVSALLEISRPVETALMVLMVSPVPPILPSKQMRLGCDEAFVYGLLTVQAALAVVLVPLSVWLAGFYYGKDLSVLPSTVGQIVLLTILLPLVAGMGVRALLPKFRERTADLCIQLAFLVLVLALVPVLAYRGAELLSMVGNGTLLAMIFVSGFGLAVGNALGGSNRDHRGTLALATAMRHPAVALAIVAANRGDLERVAAAMLLYLLVNGVVTVIYMKWFNERETATA